MAYAFVLVGGMCADGGGVDLDGLGLCEDQDGAQAGRSCAEVPGVILNQVTTGRIDINAFVEGFTNQTPAGDLNGDGLWDLGDIGIFMASFTGGCPS